MFPSIFMDIDLKAVSYRRNLAQVKVTYFCP